VRQPLDMPIREPKSSQSNINHRLGIQATEDLLPQLDGQIAAATERTSQSHGNVGESPEEGWSRRKMREHRSANVRR